MTIQETTAGATSFSADGKETDLIIEANEVVKTYRTEDIVVQALQGVT